MLRRRILAILEWFSPALRKQLAVYAAWRQRRKIERRIQPALVEITAAHGWIVLAGPFSGLRYVREARGSVLLPKLLGIYERELHDAVTLLVTRRPDAIVDVGCAEGYYAIGLARLAPASRVYAFDIDPRARRLCCDMAALNDLGDRVVVKEHCDAHELQAILDDHGRVLVVSDCEGYEDSLLDPFVAPGLANADLLIEVHEFAIPGVKASLLERFGKTHTVIRVPAVPSDPDSVALLRQFDPETRRCCASEYRPPGMEWFVCLVNAEPTQSHAAESQSP